MTAFVRNCRLCKMPMNRSPFSMCPICLIEVERVRNYLMSTPSATVSEISASTNVSRGKVIKMVNLGIEKKNRLQSKK